MPKYQVNDMVKCLAGRWDLEPSDEGYDATADKFSDTHFEEHKEHHLYGQIKRVLKTKQSGQQLYKVKFDVFVAQSTCCEAHLDPVEREGGNSDDSDSSIDSRDDISEEDRDLNDTEGSLR